MFYVKAVATTLIALVLWAFLIAAGAVMGWWRQPLAPPGDARAFMDAAVRMIQSRNPGGNTALVLIENGAAFDEYYSSSADAVDGDTVFAVASMSKWIAAWAVMKLVEEGRLDLDRPIDDYLTRWHLPDRGFDNRGVTVRRLLSHTAGLTDGLGFGDYEPDETVPPLDVSLANPRASSRKPVTIAVGREPGSEWIYSGGGYLILELLVEEVSGQSFADFTRRAVLDPLGMSRSGYEYLGGMSNSAGSYDVEGRPATVYRYACKAATGFITSAHDLTRFVLAQLPGTPGKPLRQATIDAMREPQASVMGLEIWGPGAVLYAETATGDHVFGHDGVNEPAINTAARVNPDTGDAIIVLETGSPSLATVLGFHWVIWQTGRPDFIGVPEELRRVVPVLLAGILVIVVLAFALTWRARRGRPGPAAR